MYAQARHGVLTIGHAMHWSVVYCPVIENPKRSAFESVGVIMGAIMKNTQQNENGPDHF
jgi:hypothetical protein